MTQIDQQHLITLNLSIDFASVAIIGDVPAGLRRIVPVSGGTFSGDRINGEVLPDGSDWVINRPDGVMMIDVRLTLKTDDGAFVYLTYQGRFLADVSVMAKLGKGEALAASQYSLLMTAKIECGEEKYKWLNNVIAIGRGEQSRGGASYTIFEMN